MRKTMRTILWVLLISVVVVVGLYVGGRALQDTPLARYVGLSGRSVPTVPLEGWYVEKDKDHDRDTKTSRPHEKVVVFVHGVTGNGDDTWRPEGIGPDGKKRRSWPELMRQDPAFADYDVFVVSYDSPAVRKASGIVELASALNHTLADYRILPKADDGKGQDVKVKDIVFIGHSMGNLIIRAAPMIDRAYEAESVRVPLIISIASPSAGSAIAKTAGKFSDNPHFAAMAGIDGNPFLQLLNSFWRDNAPWDTEIACAYETKKVKQHGVELVVVVDQPSATAVCTRRGPRPLETTPAGRVIPAVGGFDEDHSSIVKPTGTDGGIYRWASLHIEAAPSVKSLDVPPAHWQDNKIVIGGKDFLESNILVAMMALVIKPNLDERCDSAPSPTATCVKVERKYHIGGRDRTFEELATGEIDMFPEYTGTLLTNLLDVPVTGLRDEKYHSMEYINKLFREKRNLNRFTLLAPLGFDNSYQLIVRRKRAEELKLSSGPTISELVLKSKDLQPPLIFASTPDFFYRRDGWPGLRKTYKLQTRSGYATHDEKYGRLAKGTADVVDAYTTDPELRDTTQTVFVTLKDDQNLFPRYYSAALTTNQLLETDTFAHVHIRESLSRLEKKISEKDITDLIARAAKLGVNSGDLRYVETSRVRLEGMVKDFLIQKKILPGPGDAPAQSRPPAQSPR